MLRHLLVKKCIVTFSRVLYCVESQVGKHDDLINLRAIVGVAAYAHAKLDFNIIAIDFDGILKRCVQQFNKVV